MTRPTPGPYELYSEGRTIIVGDVATHTDLAEFFYRDEHTVSTSHDEAEANARLFMAAPNLLDAAKKSLNFLENTESELGITLETADLLRAAISLADGKSCKKCESCGRVEKEGRCISCDLDRAEGEEFANRHGMSWKTVCHGKQ